MISDSRLWLTFLGRGLKLCLILAPLSTEQQDPSLILTLHGRQAHGRLKKKGVRGHKGLFVRSWSYFASASPIKHETGLEVSYSSNLGGKLGVAVVLI